MHPRQQAARRAVGVAGAATIVGGSLTIGGEPVHAIDIEVDTLLDVVNPGDGLTSLREAVELANTTIAADLITFADGLNGTITLATPIGIAGDVSIDGPGESVLTLSSTTGDVLYLYNDAGVSISSVTFADAADSAIRSYGAGDLTLTSVTVTRSAGPGVDIDSPGTNLTIVSSTISGNFDEGVDLDDGQDMVIVIGGSEFDDNADSGLYSDSGFIASLDITSSSFSDNASTGLYLWGVGGDLTIAGSHIDRNTRDGLRVDDSLGGSIEITGTTVDDNTDIGATIDQVAGSLTIVDSSVDGNGAVGLYAYDIGVDLVISGSTMSGNASHGVYVETIGGAATVSDSSMRDNGDTGLYLDDIAGPVAISGVETVGNAANGMEVSRSGDSLTISDTRADDNAYNGIQVSNGSGSASVERSSVDGNGNSGLLLLSNAGPTTVRDVTSSNGMAEGARTFLNSGDVTFDRVTFGGNALAGVSAEADTGEITLLNSTLTGNGATTADPAISSTSASLDIRHSTISANGVAGSAAAAVEVTDTAVTVDHTILTDNDEMDAFSASGTGALTATYSLLPVGTGAGPTNIEADDIGLAPVADNGGETETMLPMLGSPALEAGDPAIVAPPATDQRGANRVVGVIDIGAVEVDGGTVSVADATVGDDAAFVDVSVTRTGPATNAASVDVATGAGTATPGADFTATTETVAWDAGELGAKTVRIPILADDVAEGDETFTVELSSPVDTVITDASATVTIVDGGPAVTPVEPARFVDTRDVGETIDDLFAADGRLDDGQEYRVKIAGRGGIPGDARAVVANVTAVGAIDTGFVTVHPCVEPRPLASSLNFTAGVNLGNEVFATLSGDGELCFYANRATHLTVDVVGYVAADAPTVPLTPARFLDTRSIGETIDGTGEAAGLTAAGSTTRLQVAGRGDVPDDAAAVIANVTVVGATDTGFVTVHPCVDPQPLASSLNHVAGVNRGNELVATLSDDGELCLFTSSAVHLTVDVVGYVPAGSTLSSVDPARLLDTRENGETIDGLAAGDGRIAAGGEVALSVGGRGDVPPDARAAIVNVTAVAPDAVGFVTVHPCVEPRPLASSLNYVPGVNGGNEIVASLNADGELCLFTSASTHLTVDVVGYLSD